METFFFSVSLQPSSAERKKKNKLVPLSSTPDRLTTSFLLSYPLPPLSSSSSSPLRSLSSSSLRRYSRTGSGRRDRGADLPGARSRPRPRSLRRRSAEGKSPAPSAPRLPPRGEESRLNPRRQRDSRPSSVPAGMVPAAPCARGRRRALPGGAH